MTLEKQHMKAYDIIKQLLEDDERCRNNDLWLTLKVWQDKQFIKLYIPYREISVMILPETISRVRRRIQNTEGMFLPTDPAVAKIRKVNEDKIRSYYSNFPEVIRDFDMFRANGIVFKRY